MEEIARAAEAVLYKDGNKVIKERVAKGYRLSVIDKQLRVGRSKREAKILEFLYPKGIVPKLLEK